MWTYIVRFENGEQFVIEASSEKEALKKTWKNYPETYGWDVHSIRGDKPAQW